MDSQVGSSRVFSVLWWWIRRSALAVAMVVLASLLPFAGQAQAKPKPTPGPAKDRSVAVEKVKKRAGEVSQSQEDLWKAPEVRWPAAGKAEVAVKDSGLVAVPGQPVRIGRPASGPSRAPGVSGLAAAEPLGEVSSEVVSQAKAKAAGVSGLMVKLTRSDEEATAAAPVSVEVDYSTLEHAFGGDWARRTQLVQLPACSVETPEKTDCQTLTPLTAKKDVKSATLAVETTVPPARSGQATVLAVTA